MRLLRWMSRNTMGDRIRNEYIYNKLEVALIEAICESLGQGFLM